MNQPVGKISGTFVDFSERTHVDELLLRWDETEWREELEDMRNAGIGLVIPARTMRYGRAYYYSRHFETQDEIDYLQPFMAAAAATSMKVYLAGLVSDSFFTGDDEQFSRIMRRDLVIYERIFGELLEIYHDHPGLAGLYVSHEADNVNMAADVRAEAAKEFFGSLYERIRRMSDLPVLSSPFFAVSSSPAELAAFWERFLDRPMFDILAMQDGVGCDRDIRPEDISVYYPPLAEVFASRGISFWHNLEIFSFNPGYRRSGYDRSKIWLHPAPLSRVERQYQAGRETVERTITWEYGHFASRRQVGEDWYEAFRRWNLGLDEE